LPSGEVLVAGGNTGATITSLAEIYDPDLNYWSSTRSMQNARFSFGIVLLGNGEVLAAGGKNLYNPLSTA